MDVLRAYKNNEALGSFRAFAFEINQSLVDGRLREPEIAEAVAALDSAIQHTEPDVDLIIYRGCGFREGEPQLEAGAAHFRGFLSTSASLGVAFRFIQTLWAGDGHPHILKITYPGRFRHHRYPANDENEILLPRNCSFNLEDWHPTFDEEMAMSILRPDQRVQRKRSAGDLVGVGAERW